MSTSISSILSLLEVVSEMVTGPGGKELTKAIQSGQVTSGDLGRLSRLAHNLQTLSMDRKMIHSSDNLVPNMLLSSTSSLLFTDSEDTVASSSSVSEGEEEEHLLSLAASSSSLPLFRTSSIPMDDDASNSSTCASVRPHPAPRSFTCAPPTKRIALSSSSISLSSSSSASTTTSVASSTSLPSLPSSLLLNVFDFVWSGKPSYTDGTDGRVQLGTLSLVCKHWRELAASDHFWRPLCIARWPWLKSLKTGPVDLLPCLDAYQGGREGPEGGRVWREFCLRHGRSMRRAGIGRRMGGGGGGGAGWGEEYTLSVEIFDRKGGFRLFCSYGRVSIMHQGVGVEGRWMTKLAVTGFASCWHFSAASRDSVHGRFETIKDYFERAHEPGLEHCLCTEVTAMHKKTGRMAVLYASSKESRRRLAGEKNGTSYFEEELRPAFASSAGVMASTASGSSHPGLPPSLSSFCAPSPGIPYLAASGIAVSKVSTPPSTSSLSPLPAGIPSMDEEKEQKYRVDRLYLIFSTERRWDLPKIFEGLEWT